MLVLSCFLYSGVTTESCRQPGIIPVSSLRPQVQLRRRQVIGDKQAFKIYARFIISHDFFLYFRKPIILLPPILMLWHFSGNSV
jgi:hypothetical protein